MGDKKYTVHQHTVPVFYLKFFSNPSNKMIQRYHKINMDIKSVSPRSVSYEDDFYEIYKIRNTDGKKIYLHRNIIENVLGNIENKFEKEFFDIINTENCNTIGKDKQEILCDYISTQLVRTTKQIKIMNKIFESETNNELISKYSKLSEYNKKLILFNSFFDYLKNLIYKQILNQCDMFFIKNSSNILFMTSDNPVILLNDSKINTFDAIYMPLSPTFALFMCDKKYNETQSKMNKMVNDEKWIKYLNCQICENSDKYIISRNFSKNDIVFLKGIGYTIKYIKCDNNK